MLKPRQAVRDLPTYHPPLGAREGLRLDFNENTVGCSPRVLERLRQLNAAQVACYPEREPSERLVATHLSLTPPETLLTNGVDEAIHLLSETYLEPGDEVLIVVPTFSLYEIYAAATGAIGMGTSVAGISGTLVVNGTLLSGHRVKLLQNGLMIDKTFTDPDGHYHFGSPGSGLYEIRAKIAVP